MGSVQIRNVRKSFGTQQVLRGISLDIEDGEFVVLVGPSGCGKSTLLRMIAGLERIGEGAIRIAGRVVNDVSPKDRNIAMVFQNYALYPHMSVFDNMSFSLRIAGAAPADVAQRVDRAAGILGLKNLLQRQPRQLSGGQRQRVAMGRAIVRDPDAFLFDEPLSNLDAKLRVHMRAEIKALHQRLSTTTIYVTHDQIEAMTMADRIVVMRDGLVEQIGTPLELYDSPANTFVAGFIGSPSMNFLDGRVEPRDGKGIFVLPSGIEVGLEDVPSTAAGKAILGIRPEHLQVADHGIPAEIIVVEPTGSETQLHARVGEQEVVALLRERRRFSPSERIHLQPMQGAAHLFDDRAGARRL
jgi:multiple sugar transport system ATP-binding protein